MAPPKHGTLENGKLENRKFGPPELPGCDWSTSLRIISPNNVYSEGVLAAKKRQGWQLHDAKRDTCLDILARGFMCLWILAEQIC